MESIWSKTCPLAEREPLPGDLAADVAVIGAGLCGILIADALQGAGCQVVVLEANRIASGQTRNTTAKITAQHGLIYHKLITTLGERRAREYAQANESAVAEYRRIIDERGIDCDFEEQKSCVYGMDRAQLEAEAESALKLGLNASYVEETPLPFSTAGAVCFEGQAQFHPLKFLSALTEPLTIYEHTTVLRVEGQQIVTNRGTVTAKHIVFACHYPFVNFPGMFFARMHQERSYVLALENAKQMEGMWIGSGEHVYSFRRAGDLLLLGGGGHRCGENSAGGKYDELRRRAKQWFPDSREAAHWSAQDCVTVDKVPYIGRYAASQPNWYVATGFRKWGMTHSMVSAMLLRDLICGSSSVPCPEVFDPGRFDTAAVAGMASMSGHAIKALGRRFFQVPSEKAAEIPIGHGGIVTLDGEKVGVYKDMDGTLHSVDIRCSHMGCQLEWNPDELSWDCPCHGSRYDKFGNLISGPAQEGLKQELRPEHDPETP